MFLGRIIGDNAISSSVSLFERNDNYVLLRLASQSIIGSVRHYVEHWKKFFRTTA